MKKHSFIRKLALVASAMMLVFLVGCSSKPNGIEGTWKRTDGSRDDGMVVKVEKLKDGTYRGTITDTPDPTFAVGDVKWNNMKSTTDKGFDLEDTSDTKFAYNMHGELTDENTFDLRDLVKLGEKGSTQTWKRVQ